MGKYSWQSVRFTIKGMNVRVRESVLPALTTAPMLPGLPTLDLEALFPTGTYFDLVFSRSDVGYHHLMQHGPARIRKLASTRDFRLHTIRDADHTFSTPLNACSWIASLHSYSACSLRGSSNPM